MKIRRIILISFFLLLTFIALPLMAVLFFLSKSEIKDEINSNLNSNATMLMEQVDMLMFERMQNVHSWGRLDVIQEARIGDVDKQLSEFLTDVESSYNALYYSLFYLDNDDRIVAASHPELIGGHYIGAVNETKSEVPNGAVYVSGLNNAEFPYEDISIAMRSPVYDSYSLKNIGQLYCLFDVHQLFQLLDKASRYGSSERYIVLLDGNGQVIAASENLRKQNVIAKPLFSDWKPVEGNTLFVHKGDPVTKSDVLVGYASSKGYLGYAQMGWSILVFESTDEAFLPIRSLLLMFFMVISVTMVLALLVSHWVSGFIAKPVLALTQWVSAVRNLDTLPEQPVEGVVEIRELATTFHDVFEELQQSREQVIQTAKLAVVGEMSAIMAHEIRTPLGIISTSAQLLQREEGLAPEIKEMTQFILDESARLTRLVTTLLESARPREPQMLENDLHDLIRHVIDLLSMQADHKNIHIDQQLQLENPVILCDGELLTQALLNLLLNAIQVLPENGFIQVKSTDYEHYVSIEISDNGAGISVEDYQHLFEPFFTKREGGIGLGLTVTKQIILAHNGKLNASPSEWGGACFILQLPKNQD